MAPNRRHDLARLGMRALFVGFTATLLNASIAGIFLPDVIDVPPKVPAAQVQQNPAEPTEPSAPSGTNLPDAKRPPDKDSVPADNADGKTSWEVTIEFYAVEESEERLPLHAFNRPTQSGNGRRANCCRSATYKSPALASVMSSTARRWSS